MRPSLEEVQKSINLAGITILKGAQMILLWGQERKGKPSSLKTCHHDIARSKQIVKVSHHLSSDDCTDRC